LSQTAAAWVEAIAAVASLGLTIWLIWYAHRGWDAAERSANAAATQADLMRKQLVGTMGAVLMCNINLADGGVSVACVNVGQVSAMNIDCTVAVIRVTVPDLTPLGESVEYGLRCEAVAPKKPCSRICVFNRRWLPSHDWDTFFAANPRTIRVDVQYAYDNGFGDAIRGRKSAVYLPGWVVQVRGGEHSSGPGFQDVDAVAAVWQDVARRKQDAAHGEYG
jgi:hypothetical protein